MKTFKACKHLSFNQEEFTCELVKVGSHLGWERFDPKGHLQLCQQCKLRGRLNSVDSCIGKEHAACHEYEEKIYEIED